MPPSPPYQASSAVACGLGVVVLALLYRKRRAIIGRAILGFAGQPPSRPIRAEDAAAAQEVLPVPLPDQPSLARPAELPSLATPHEGGPGRISAGQWAVFDERGFVVLPREQVLAPGELEALQARIDQIQLGEADVPYDEMMMQLDSSTGRYEDAGEQTLGFKGPTLRYRKIQNLDRDPLVMTYLRNPLFREACARVYGRATPIASFRTMFFSKPSRHEGSGVAGGTALPWHQDRWQMLDRDPLLNAYLALDAATPQSGCVWLLPGSHRLGLINPDHHSAFLTEAQACTPCARLCAHCALCSCSPRPSSSALRASGGAARDRRHAARAAAAPGRGGARAQLGRALLRPQHHAAPAPRAFGQLHGRAHAPRGRHAGALPRRRARRVRLPRGRRGGRRRLPAHLRARRRRRRRRQQR
eukprot:Transcript_19116.p1 GENE.Transcript_19116~~Transcript_19116.p1  ORF type:complete len:415 (+),score=75.93 Transcript_19116:169-1413(+)